MNTSKRIIELRIRNLPIAALTAFCMASLIATAGSGVGLGAKVGLVMSDQSLTNTEISCNLDSGRRTGLALGLFIKWPVIPLVSIQSELQYIQKGSQLTVLSQENGGMLPDNQKRDDCIEYISAAVMGRAAFPIIRGGPYLLVGPRMDIKLDGDSEVLSATSAELESMVFGATLAVGQEFSIGPVGKVLLEVCYHHDFTDAYDLPNWKVKNRAFGFMVGVRF